MVKLMDLYRTLWRRY